MKDGDKLWYFCGDRAVELLGDGQGRDRGRELDEVLEKE